jgi:tetratricopeptide (TPR) repeat protein
LTAGEDLEVHEELRGLIHPTADRLSCARLASAMGRRLIALKLATACAHDGPQAVTARALRITLLRQIGEEGAALSDARQWTVDHGDTSQSWATYADELVLSGRKGEAVEALKKATEAAPEAWKVRARLAQLMMDLEHFGHAQAEARAVLEQRGDREATLAALEVMAQYVELLIARNDAQAVEEAIGTLGERSRRHAAFLCASAWLALREDERSRARRDLKLARKLQPDHPLIGELEAQVKEAKKGWWGW